MKNRFLGPMWVSSVSGCHQHCAHRWERLLRGPNPMDRGTSVWYHGTLTRPHTRYQVSWLISLCKLWNGLEESADGGSVWKPLKGPVQEWPLAVCDARTVDTKQDLIKLDSIFPQGFNQGHIVFHSLNHRWSYLSHQKTSELWVFNSADTQGCPPGRFFTL